MGEYQRELWRSEYYEYYNLEGGAEDEDEDEDAVDFGMGGCGFHQQWHVARTSHRRLISHRRRIGQRSGGFVKIIHT